MTSSANTKAPAATHTPAPPFIVGISGASSSGKTVLSLLLADLVKTAMAHGSTAAPTVTIISQDDYFLPKSECPTTKFRPRVGDEQTCMAYVGDDNRVETADTDCLPAVDWCRLHKDIKAFIKGDVPSGTASKSAHQEEAASYGDNMTSFLSQGEHQHLCREIWEGIDDNIMLNMSADYEGSLFKEDGVRGDLLNARILIVEGFLLYAREKPLRPAPTALDPEQPPAAPRAPPAALAGRAKASHEALAALLDVRLYLHITPELGFVRRFARAPYRDAPRGARVPGQLWKTHGYFFDVVRAHFYGYDLLPAASLTQLFQGRAVAEGAVRGVLAALAAREAVARHRWATLRQLERAGEGRGGAAMVSLAEDAPPLWALATRCFAQPL